MKISLFFKTMSRKFRTDFRKEFPQLCAVPVVEAPLSFAHIKDIVEPLTVEVKTLPYGWIDLSKPDTWVTFLPQPTSHQRMCMAIDKMRRRWIAYNIAHGIDARYDEELEYEEEESDVETDSISAEDPEYESDF